MHFIRNNIIVQTYEISILECLQMCTSKCVNKLTKNYVDYNSDAICN